MSNIYDCSVTKGCLSLDFITQTLSSLARFFLCLNLAENVAEIVCSRARWVNIEHTSEVATVDTECQAHERLILAWEKKSSRREYESILIFLLHISLCGWSTFSFCFYRNCWTLFCSSFHAHLLWRFQMLKTIKNNAMSMPQLDIVLMQMKSGSETVLRTRRTIVRSCGTWWWCNKKIFH